MFYGVMLSIAAARADLFWGAQCGQPLAVRLSLAAGADINSKSVAGETALIFAVRSRRRPPIRLALEAGAAVDYKTDYLWGALHWVAADNIHQAVRGLLVAADVDVKNKFGKTALHWAAEYDYYLIVRELLAAGADTTIKNKYGKTAVELAVEYNCQRAANEFAAFNRREN